MKKLKQKTRKITNVDQSNVDLGNAIYVLPDGTKVKTLPKNSSENKEWVIIDEPHRTTSIPTILLPEVTVTAPGKPGTFTSNNPEDLKHEASVSLKNLPGYDPYYNYRGSLLDLDPIIGQRRLDLIANGYYNDNNPFKQANDLVGNVAADAILGSTLAYPAGKGLYMLGKSGLWGRLAGQLIGGGLGASLGDYLFNESISKPITGKTFADNYLGTGGDVFGASLSNPGVLGGGLFGSAIADGAIVNGKAFLNNAIPRLTMLITKTPTRPTVGNVQRIADPILQRPGDPAIVVDAPGSTDLPGGTRVGYEFSGSYSNPKGVRGYGHKTVGPTGGGKSGAQSSAGRGNKVGTTGSSRRPLIEVSGQKARNNQVVIETPLQDYSPVVATPIPWMSTTPITTVVPTPEIPKKEPKTRVEKTSIDPWEIWYSTQPEGTIQHWKGNKNSSRPEGDYKIQRTGNVGSLVVRQIGTGRNDFRGENKVVPDSTSNYLTKTVLKDRNGNIRVLLGGVDPNTSISEELLLTPEEFDMAYKKYIDKKLKGGLLPRFDNGSFLGRLKRKVTNKAKNEVINASKNILPFIPGIGPIAAAAASAILTNPDYSVFVPSPILYYRSKMKEQQEKNYKQKLLKQLLKQNSANIVNNAQTVLDTVNNFFGSNKISDSTPVTNQDNVNLGNSRSGQKPVSTLTSMPSYTNTGSNEFTGSFGQAFKQARSQGLTSFNWRGRNYSTIMNGENNDTWLANMQNAKADYDKLNTVPTPDTLTNPVPENKTYEDYANGILAQVDENIKNNRPVIKGTKYDPSTVQGLAYARLNGIKGVGEYNDNLLAKKPSFLKQLVNFASTLDLNLPGFTLKSNPINTNWTLNVQLPTLAFDSELYKKLDSKFGRFLT